MKKFIKNLTPPIILKIYQKKNKRYGYFGNYSSWKEAKKHSTGYDDDVIIEKVKESALKVKKGQAVYERDSVIFDKIEHFWPLLAGLLWIASQNKNKLNLIDFGGSLGTSYFQNIKFLNHLNELTWSIVEQKKITDYGKKFFEDKHLKFYYTLEECIKEQQTNTILVSSVLQYLEKPYKFLEEIIDFPYIIFDRTTFIKDLPDRLTVQKVSPAIYKASYPAWFFNLDNFKQFFSEKYDLIVEFESLVKKIDLKDTTAIEKGFIFKLKK